jgi:hypothetical protein
MVDLQFKQVGANADFVAEVVTLFNDWKTTTGGLIDPDDILLIENAIDPDKRNFSGPISASRVFEYLKSVIRIYSNGISKFNQATGVHDQKYFPNYVGNNIDAYYLFLALRKEKIESDFTKLFEEGTEITGGCSSSRSYCNTTG